MPSAEDEKPNVDAEELECGEGADDAANAPTKKRKKKKAKAKVAPESEKPVETRAEIPANRPAKSTPVAASEEKAEAAASADVKPSGPKANAEEFYNAAAVVFFSRDAAGAVAKVLVAVEERKVQATYIGLPQAGKIVQRMLLFPMGRRERKDKGDTVDTAKREYVEETGDYGGLSKYLDFADFPAPGEKPAAAEEEEEPLERDDSMWTGRQNMAAYFVPASMIALFCEVPAKATLANHRAASEGITVEELAAKKEAEVQAAKAEAAKAVAKAAKESDEGPARKKPKKEKAPKPAAIIGNPSFSVGKTDHLEPAWLEAEVLKKAISTGHRSPTIEVRGEECRLFPTAASLLRLPDVRHWLGMDDGKP